MFITTRKATVFWTVLFLAIVLVVTGAVALLLSLTPVPWYVAPIAVVAYLAGKFSS